MHEQSVIMNHLSCMPRCHAKLPTLHEVPVYLTPLLYQVLIVFKRVCALIGLHGKPGALLHTHTHTCKNNPFTTPHFTFHLTGLVCVCVWRLALFPGYSHCPVFGYQNWLPKKKKWKTGRWEGLGTSLAIGLLIVHASINHIGNTSLTASHAWDSLPYFPVTPAQLKWPGIG